MYDPEIHAAQQQLCEALKHRVTQPGLWSVAVWNWVADPNGLARLFWRRLVGWHATGEAVWPDGHAPRGPCPYLPEAKSDQSEAVDFFCERIAELVQTLIEHGIRPEWDEAQAPLALYLTHFDEHNARRRIQELRETVSGDTAQDHDDGDSPNDRRTAPPHREERPDFELHPQLNPERRPAHMAGLQLQPSLRWDVQPAPALRQVLCTKVITVGKETGEEWEHLLGAHSEAESMYLAERDRHATELNRLYTAGHQALSVKRKLDRMRVRHLLHPLNRKVVCALTGWSDNAAWKYMERYSEALEHGGIIANREFGHLRIVVAESDDDADDADGGLP